MGREEIEEWQRRLPGLKEAELVGEGSVEEGYEWAEEETLFS